MPRSGAAAIVRAAVALPVLQPPMLMRRFRSVATLAVALVVLPAVAPALAPAAALLRPAAADSLAPRRIARVDSLHVPESAQYDAETDRWFVSSVGRATVADGFITRLRGDGTVEALRFVAHGRDGVTLASPRGLAIQGDTLWVNDDRTLRAFDKRTGASLGAVELAPLGAMLLNDVAVGPDGALYLTDSGLRRENDRWQHVGPDRVFVVRGRVPAPFVTDSLVDYPNGVFWDAPRARLLVTEVRDSVLYAWTPAGRGAEVARGPGGYDGVVVLTDGTTLVSSWADSSVHVIEQGRLRPLVRGVTSPADIGVDARRARIGVPRLNDDAFELWEVPRLRR